MRKLTWALLVSILATGPTPAFSQPANTYTFGPDVRITDVPTQELGTSSGFTSSGQHYTAFRGDTVYVVWWESRTSFPPTGNHVLLAKSTDCGTTFGSATRVNDLPAGFNPSMRVDSSGIIYVAYQRLGDIYFTKSTDGGTTFAPSVLVVDTGETSTNQLYPSIALNNKSQVFIAWVDERTNPQSVFTSASYDSGQTFMKNVQVAPGYNGVENGFDIAADDNGGVYLAYSDTLEGLYRIVVARSNDSGQSFGSFASASQPPLPIGQPSLAISDEGLIGVAYAQHGVRFSISTDSGRTFSSSVRVDTGYSEVNCGNGLPSLVTNRGMFYVAWTGGRQRLSDSDCIYNIFLSYSPDDGRSFVKELGTDTTGRSFAHTGGPSLSVSATGKAFVAWIDDREDPVTQILWRIFGTTAIPHFVKGDLNLDSLLTAADAVMELNAVYLAQPYPAPFASADVNCDSELTAADVVLHLNATFLGEAFPCL